MTSTSVTLKRQELTPRIDQSNPELHSGLEYVRTSLDNGWYLENKVVMLQRKRKLTISTYNYWDPDSVSDPWDWKGVGWISCLMHYPLFLLYALLHFVLQHFPPWTLTHILAAAGVTNCFFSLVLSHLHTLISLVFQLLLEVSIGPETYHNDSLQRHLERNQSQRTLERSTDACCQRDWSSWHRQIESIEHHVWRTSIWNRRNICKIASPAIA